MYTTIIRMLQRHTFSIFLALLVFSGFTSYAQNCSSVLTVEKDRNVRSADEDGAQFFVILKNTSSGPASYTLASEFSSASCDTSNRRSSNPNVELAVSFKDPQRRSLAGNEITLQPNETYRFLVEAMAPQGTPFDSWSCIQIKAIPNNCRNNPSTTLLRVYVPDPTEG